LFQLPARTVWSGTLHRLLRRVDQNSLPNDMPADAVFPAAGARQLSKRPHAGPEKKTHPEGWVVRVLAFVLRRISRPSLPAGISR
jgi:hypothetical protein